MSTIYVNNVRTPDNSPVTFPQGISGYQKSTEPADYAYKVTPKPIATVTSVTPVSANQTFSYSGGGGYLGNWTDGSYGSQYDNSYQYVGLRISYGSGTVSPVPSTFFQVGSSYTLGSFTVVCASVTNVNTNEWRVMFKPLNDDYTGWSQFYSYIQSTYNYAQMPSAVAMTAQSLVFSAPITNGVAVTCGGNSFTGDGTSSATKFGTWTAGSSVLPRAAPFINGTNHSLDTLNNKLVIPDAELTALAVTGTTTPAAFKSIVLGATGGRYYENGLAINSAKNRRYVKLQLSALSASTSNTIRLTTDNSGVPSATNQFSLGTLGNNYKIAFVWGTAISNLSNSTNWSLYGNKWDIRIWYSQDSSPGTGGWDSGVTKTHSSAYITSTFNYGTDTTYSTLAFTFNAGDNSGKYACVVDLNALIIDWND